MLLTQQDKENMKKLSIELKDLKEMSQIQSDEIMALQKVATVQKTEGEKLKDLAKKREKVINFLKTVYDKQPKNLVKKTCLTTEGFEQYGEWWLSQKRRNLTKPTPKGKQEILLEIIENNNVCFYTKIVTQEELDMADKQKKIKEEEKEKRKLEKEKNREVLGQSISDEVFKFEF